MERIDKTCIKCNETKALSEFWKRSSKDTARQSYCKQCHSQKNREWLENNSERKRERSRQWAALNKDRRRENHQKWYAANRERQLELNKLWQAANRAKKNGKLYGLSEEQYFELLDRAGGRCEVCQRAEGRLCVDHCHVTGEVRGVLCSRCNTGVGMLGDCAEGIRSALDYFERVEARRSQKESA